MKLCDDGHQEVVFEAGECPVCAAKAASEKVSEENARLQADVEKLEGEVAQLEFEKEENPL